MDSLDARAFDEAKKALSKGWSWQAYLTLVAAEYRTGSEDPAPEEYQQPSNDSISAMYSKYKTTGDSASLHRILDACVATLSELYRSTSGEDRQAVEKACEAVCKIR